MHVYVMHVPDVGNRLRYPSALEKSVLAENWSKKSKSNATHGVL